MPRPELKPLSAERYSLKVTLSAEVHDKLVEAQALLRHRNPDGDLDVVLGKALDALLRDLRAAKFGETESPREPSPKPKAVRARSRHISSVVRRRVAARDGHRCTYVDEQGRRCEERAFLEYDHAVPFARGGASDEGSVRLRCRAHNRQAADEAFGEAFMRRKIEEATARDRATPGGESRRDPKCDPAPAPRRP